MHLETLRHAARMAAEREDRMALLSALRVLAGALAEAGEQDEALQIHEQVIQLDPADVAALAALGRSAPPPLGRSSPARMGGAPVQDVLELGLAYAQMGLWSEAIGRWEEALALDPAHRPTAETLLGFFSSSDGRAALKGCPEDERLRIRYLLGRSAEALGNRASAREFYEEVVSSDPTLKDAVQRLRDLGG